MANQNEGDKEQKLSSWGLVQPAVLILIMEEPRHGYALLEELKTRGFLPNSADGGNVYRGSVSYTHLTLPTILLV